MPRITIDTYKTGLRRRYLDLRDSWRADVSANPTPQPNNPKLLEMQAIRAIARLRGWIDEVDDEVES